MSIAKAADESVKWLTRISVIAAVAALGLTRLDLLGSSARDAGVQAQTIKDHERRIDAAETTIAVYARDQAAVQTKLAELTTAQNATTAAVQDLKQDLRAVTAR